MKILDFSTLLPGPEATKILQEEGHKVIKIENENFPDMLKLMRPTQDGISVIYKNLNKNKEIIQLDFRNTTDINKIIDLVKTSDVVVENMRPGRMEKFRLGYEDLKQYNENLIYISISGYPKDHIWSKKAAHDLNILAVSGYFDYVSKYSTVLSVPPIQIVDIATSFYIAIKILSLKLNNKGIHLNIAMTDALKYYFDLLSPLENYDPNNVATNFPLWGTCLCYNIYKTQDDKYVALAAFENSLWLDFCNENNLKEIEDKQFSTNQTDLEIIKQFVATKTWEYFNTQNSDYCLTPVLNFKQAKDMGFYE